MFILCAVPCGITLDDATNGQVGSKPGNMYPLHTRTVYKLCRPLCGPSFNHGKPNSPLQLPLQTAREPQSDDWLIGFRLSGASDILQLCGNTYSSRPRYTSLMEEICFPKCWKMDTFFPVFTIQALTISLQGA